jgi:hypothetical protein
MIKKTTPSSIFETVSKLDPESFPPVHLWDPPICKNVDMKIDREGRWYFMDSPIGRERMVKLFSRVLRLDEDGNYYLVTPIEKILLKVEDKPFLIIDYRIEHPGKNQKIFFTTNTLEEFVVGKKHPLRVFVNKSSEEPSPYVLVRSNLEGLLSRNVFYKLIDLATIYKSDLGLWSDGKFFKLE